MVVRLILTVLIAAGSVVIPPQPAAALAEAWVITNWPPPPTQPQLILKIEG